MAATNLSTTTVALPTTPELEPVKAVQVASGPVGTIATMIREASAKYGVDDNLALEIARCESGLRQYDQDGQVVRGQVNPKDIGVFQVNENYHLKKSLALGLDIYTTRGNIEYAMSLIKKSGDQPWSASRACWHDHVALK